MQNFAPWGFSAEQFWQRIDLPADQATSTSDRMGSRTRTFDIGARRGLRTECRTSRPGDFPLSNSGSASTYQQTKRLALPIGWVLEPALLTSVREGGCALNAELRALGIFR